MRSRAERMLFNLPPEARELYELQFGAEARQALDTAIQEFDATQLARVRRRYSATESGLVASMILGRHYLNTQRPMAALLCFQQLSDSQVGRQKFGTELPLLTAIAARRAGQTETARTVLVQLKQDTPSVSYDVAGTQVELFDSDDNALVWLDNLIGTLADSVSIPVADWLTHRGNNQRNAESMGSMPLLNVLWEVEVTTNPLDIELHSRTPRAVARAKFSADSLDPAISHRRNCVHSWPASVGRSQRRDRKAHLGLQLATNEHWYNERAIRVKPSNTTEIPPT